VLHRDRRAPNVPAITHLDDDERLHGQQTSVGTVTVTGKIRLPRDEPTPLEGSGFQL